MTLLIGSNVVADIAMAEVKFPCLDPTALSCEQEDCARCADTDAGKAIRSTVESKLSPR
jgi:hypothetical protein